MIKLNTETRRHKGKIFKSLSLCAFAPLCLIFLILLLTGCSQAPLSVFTEYVSVESLPSFQVGTPDPRLYCPDTGEKLHISWGMPVGSCYKDLEIKLFLRFGNGEDKELNFPLFDKKGTLVYPLLNEDYWNKKGVFTYKIELYADETLIDTWIHQLWAERITMN